MSATFIFRRIARPGNSCKHVMFAARLRIRDRSLSSLIWFQLLDSVDGKLYKNTTATSVSPPPGFPFLVDQFRDAVKVKYDYPEYLKNVPSATLLVYKNKASFDADDDPLDEEYSLTNVAVGKSKKDALVVVVPSFRSTTNKQVESLKQQVGFDTELDVTCCKLSTDFLKDAGLHSYASAAVSCAKDSKVIELLNNLEQYDVPDKGPCSFTCIVAPSGTGKTQLAATAATANKNVVYFYTGSTDNDLVQEFYRPHVEVKNMLLKIVRDLQESEMTIIGDSIRGADFVYNTFLQKESPVFSFLYKCFFGSPSMNTVTLGNLRDRILKEEKKLIVFLDEVPPRHYGQFCTVMLLRNILRAVGVSPVLMSTHTGSVDAVKGGADSRVRDQSSKWCRIIVNLPEYQADERVFNDNPWLVRSERPLVAAMMVNLTEKSDISIIVDEIQKKLQEQKPMAWLDTPGIQLCQLFRSKACNVKPSYKHQIVGFHFGRIFISEDACEITRRETKRWMEKQLVEFVDPEMEPVLFLALTTWKMAHIQEDSDQFFPLVEETRLENQWRTLSIRGAFNVASHYFSKPIVTTNILAKKLDDNYLEVLALASITLASLQSDNGVFQSVKLPQFLASVFHFMCPNDLKANDIIETSIAIRTLLADSLFSSVTVPTCPTADSCFSQVWSGHSIPSFLSGRVKGPTGAQRHDCFVWCGIDEILHVECNNLGSGVSCQVARKVVNQMKRQGKVSIFFISDMSNIFTTSGKWQDFTKEVNIHNHSICCLLLQPGKMPAWLTIKQGTITLDCQREAEHLAVFIAIGTVELDSFWK